MKTWQQLKNNPSLLSSYLLREQVVDSTRSFFKQQGFKEVEVPLLSSALIPESYLEIFETEVATQYGKRPAYLTPSPEVFLKKLLVAGIGSCFTITKSFRNSELFSSLHNPEFSMLEWYRIDADYFDVMEDTEKLFCSIYEQVIRSDKPAYADKLKDSSTSLGMTFSYQGKTIDLTPPWERLSMIEAFQKYANLDVTKILTREEIAPVAQAKGYTVSAADTWEHLFHQIYLNEVEPQFGKGKPTIIYDFPSQIAALAQKKKSDPRFAQRFEVFIEGLELADAYSELTDAQEQAQRFSSETAERKRLGKIAHPNDDDFIDALKEGLPKCSGCALGMDRLVMLFADVATIEETLFFPARELWES